MKVAKRMLFYCFLGYLSCDLKCLICSTLKRGLSTSQGLLISCLMRHKTLRLKLMFGNLPKLTFLELNFKYLPNEHKDWNSMTTYLNDPVHMCLKCICTRAVEHCLSRFPYFQEANESSFLKNSYKNSFDQYYYTI